MQTNFLQQKIDHFWEWFFEHENVFREDDVPAELVEQLDNHILDFGLFSWQIGDADTKQKFLTISPNGNPKRLELSQQIIDAAPYSGNWEFNYCKQAIDWDYVFEMYDSFMVLQTIDASDWEYTMVEKTSGNVQISLRVMHPSLTDFMDKKAAGDLVMTNILGEEDLIECVEDLILVRSFIPEHQYMVKKLPSLKQDFYNIFY